jgi:hypothetical protein
MESKHANLADALEHSELAETATELVFTTPKMYHLFLKDPAFEAAVKRVMDRPVRITIKVGEPVRAAEPGATPVPARPDAAPVRSEAAQSDSAAGRALEHPEVQKFQELFPGSQVRAVRNLRENEA